MFPLARRLAVVAAVVCAPFAAAPAASAMSLPAPPEWIWHDVAPDGASALAARNASGPVVEWQRCRAMPSGLSDCVTLRASDPAAGRLVMRDEDAGHVIRATAPDGESGVIHYGGPLRATAAPSVAGEARVGAPVRVVGASWSGGFGREQSHIQLQACRDAAASVCVPISDSVFWNRCAATGVRIPQRYRGWYLRAVDRRIGEHTVFPAIAYLSPETAPMLVPGAATAVSTTVGPVAPGAAPRGDCVPPAPPTSTQIRLRRRAGRSVGRLLVASVRCPDGCRVDLALTRRGRTVRSSTAAPAGVWTAVALPRRKALRLGAGTATVQLTVTSDAAPVPLAPVSGEFTLPKGLLARLAR